MRKRSWKRLTAAVLASVMALSLAACGGGGSGETQAAAEGETQAAGDTGAADSGEAASGDQITISFMHRFPDEPYNSFIHAKLAE